MHDRLLAKILEDISSYGHTVIGVADGKHPFAYTIGLFSDKAFGFELMIVGLRPDLACVIINEVASKIRDGWPLQFDLPDERWANLPVLFKRTNENEDLMRTEYFVQADQYYGTTVPVVQIVMPDKEGNFPGDEKYDTEYMDPRQPLFFKVAA
jgi:hypothetical protein